VRALQRELLQSILVELLKNIVVVHTESLQAQIQRQIMHRAGVPGSPTTELLQSILLLQVESWIQ
jgi:hypothetical protein